MWPDSVFAVPVGSFVSPVPVVDADPTTGPFVYVKVNKLWLPYVEGCLLQLLLQTTWATTDPATLNLVQQRAMQLLQMFSVAPDHCPDDGYATVIEESDYEMSLCEQLRFQDGKLQALCCGEWTDIAGQTPGTNPAGPTQPGGGQPQPAPGGGCQDYHGDMRASEAWYAPTGVSAGDIITVTSTSGAASDAGFSRWTCPDGSSFFLGSCIGDTGSTDPADPMPAVKHGALIVNIGGTFYNPASPITVPTGVANVPLIFQRNAATLTGASGDYAFDFTVCNNAELTFTHRFDFRTGGQQGWLFNNPNLHDTFVLGTGFVSGFDSIDNFTGTQIHLPLTATEITGMSLEYTASGVDPSGVVEAASILPTPISFVSVSVRNGTLAEAGANEAPGTTKLQVDVFTSAGAGNIGSAVLSAITVSGKGPDPF